MIALGKYRIESWSLQDSIELSNTIFIEFNAEISREDLAKYLKMSSRGGAFAARLGALRGWGLADGRSQIKLTQEAIVIAKPDTTVKGKQQHLLGIVRKSPLIISIIEELPKLPVDDTKLAEVISQITSASLTEVMRHIPLIQKTLVYIKDHLPINIIKSSVHTRQSVKAKPVVHQKEQSIELGASNGKNGKNGEIHLNGKNGNTTPIDPDQGYIKLLIGNQSEIYVKETPENLDAVMLVLWARRREIAQYQIKKGVPAIGRLFNPNILNSLEE